MDVKILIEGNQVDVVLAGKLDTPASISVAKDFDRLIENAEKDISLDCRGMDYISSSGLRLLLSLRKATLAKKGHLVICNINDSVRNVFTLTGFLNLFEFK